MCGRAIILVPVDLPSMRPGFGQLKIWADKTGTSRPHGARRLNIDARCLTRGCRVIVFMGTSENECGGLIDMPSSVSRFPKLRSGHVRRASQERVHTAYLPEETRPRNRVVAGSFGEGRDAILRQSTPKSGLSSLNSGTGRET
jgi:hypothetical protein